MKQIASIPQKSVSAFSSADAFESAQRMALALVSSSLVPAQYQGKENLGNAIIALEMAQRIDASPLLVMQNLYIVHGNPGWSAKFLIATFNQCGRFSAIRYEWKGEAGQKDRACRAWAMERDTGERVDGPWIDWDLISGEKWDSKTGSKWKTMPEKMFRYRAAAWMIDTVAPELSMGLPTADQIDDVGGYHPPIDVTPAKTLTDLLPAKEVMDTETGEIIETPDAEVLISLAEVAVDTDILDTVLEAAQALDKRTSEYQRVVDLVAIRRDELSA